MDFKDFEATRTSRTFVLLRSLQGSHPRRGNTVSLPSMILRILMGVPSSKRSLPGGSFGTIFPLMFRCCRLYLFGIRKIIRPLTGKNSLPILNIVVHVTHGRLESRGVEARAAFLTCCTRCVTACAATSWAYSSSIFNRRTCISSTTAWKTSWATISEPSASLQKWRVAIRSSRPFSRVQSANTSPSTNDPWQLQALRSAAALR